MKGTQTMRCAILGLLVLLAPLSCRSSAVAPTTAPAGPRVLIILAEGFNRGEFWDPYRALKGAGYRVDVAGPAKGVIECNPGKPGPNDATADLSLDAVNSADYAALVIPGGYSPGNLEKFPRSIEICREFAAEKKLIAAICHGPRLLARGDMLKGRVIACYYAVANEMADQWAAGAFGHYVDQPIVRDGQLLTSRYPNDSMIFAREVVMALHNAGGPPPAPTTRPVPTQPSVAPTVTLALADGFDDRTFAAVDGLLRIKGQSIGVVANEKGWRLGANGLAVFAAGKLADSSAPLPRYTVSAQGLSRDDGQQIPDDLAAVAKISTTTTSAEGPFSAVIALREGFDDRTATALRAYLISRGRRVAVVGAKIGPVRGLGGLPLTVSATYNDKLDLAPDALIVMPGGFWPQKDPAARQAKQPAWIDEQAQRDARRLAWTMERYNAGATLLTFGLDGLAVGTQPQFAKKVFATTDQAMWAFGSAGGKYSGELAVQSAPRLVSAKGIDALGKAVSLLEAPQATTQP